MLDILLIENSLKSEAHFSLSFMVKILQLFPFFFNKFLMKNWERENI